MAQAMASPFFAPPAGASIGTGLTPRMPPLLGQALLGAARSLFSLPQQGLSALAPREASAEVIPRDAGATALMNLYSPGAGESPDAFDTRLTGLGFPEWRRRIAAIVAAAQRAPERVEVMTENQPVLPASQMPPLTTNPLASGVYYPHIGRLYINPSRKDWADLEGPRVNLSDQPTLLPFGQTLGHELLHFLASRNQPFQSVVPPTLDEEEVVRLGVGLMDVIPPLETKDFGEQAPISDLDQIRALLHHLIMGR